MLPVFLLLLILAEFGQAEPDRRFNALKFGHTAADYIKYKPNLQPLQDALSVCSWVKKLRSDGYPKWFHYRTSSTTYEILIVDDGRDTHMLDVDTDVSSKMDNAIGEWYHICITWTRGSGNTKKVYYNGEMIGTDSPPNRQLGLDGYLVLGNLQTTYGGGFSARYAFGGELFKLNVFAKELSATEVKEMADGGLCSEVEDRYGRERYLKWEDILLEERGDANVTEIDAGCPQSQESEEISNEVEAKEEKDEECECAAEGNVTYSRWDMLYSAPYHNKTVNQDILDSLRSTCISTWDLLGPFFGSTINDEFIDHFKEFHEGQHACGE